MGALEKISAAYDKADSLFSDFKDSVAAIKSKAKSFLPEQTSASVDKILKGDFAGALTSIKDVVFNDFPQKALELLDSTALGDGLDSLSIDKVWRGEGLDTVEAILDQLSEVCDEA